jgi:HKD family nuclease
MINFLHQPEGAIRLGDFLKSHLEQQEWTHFRAAIAFVKRSGTRHIYEALSSFSKQANVIISVGIDAGGTSMEGLQDLLESVGNRGEIWVYHNENNSTFHPKIYLFKNDKQADIVVGSGNLTEGGLFTNYEASLSKSLDLTLQADSDLLQSIENTLDTWSHLAPKTSVLLTPDILNQLVTNEDVPTEAEAKETEEISTRFRQSAERAKTLQLFARVPVPKAPVLERRTRVNARESSDQPHNFDDGNFEVEIPTPIISQQENFVGFLMTLQQTDVGHGQITSGTTRRSPEIFIPLAARDHNPDFWYWPDGFIADQSRPQKKDRKGVKMRIGTKIVKVNMMTWPDKSDFRLRNETLRSAGNIGDILRIEKMDEWSDFAYYVEVIPHGTMLHSRFLALCTNSVRNSNKRWGYYSSAELDDETIRLPQTPQHSS